MVRNAKTVHNTFINMFLAHTTVYTAPSFPLSLKLKKLDGSDFLQIYFQIKSSLNHMIWKMSHTVPYITRMCNGEQYSYFQEAHSYNSFKKTFKYQTVKICTQRRNCFQYKLFLPAAFLSL